MRGPRTLSYIEAFAGCRSEGDKHSKDLRLLLDRQKRRVTSQHRQSSRQATEAKDSRCARRARLGCAQVCESCREGPFTRSTLGPDEEAQTGLRTVVGVMC